MGRELWIGGRKSVEVSEFSQIVLNYTVYYKKNFKNISKNVLLGYKTKNTDNQFKKFRKKTKNFLEFRKKNKKKNVKYGKQKKTKKTLKMKLIFF